VQFCCAEGARVRGGKKGLSQYYLEIAKSYINGFSKLIFQGHPYFFGNGALIFKQ
jgi:hypothetical protein